MTDGRRRLREEFYWRIGRHLPRPRRWLRHRRALRVYGPLVPFAHFEKEDAEILVYKGVLNPEDRTQVERYLNSKWDTSNPTKPVVRHYTPPTY